jgi:hypothetical protein
MTTHGDRKSFPHEGRTVKDEEAKKDHNKHDEKHKQHKKEKE